MVKGVSIDTLHEYVAFCLYVYVLITTEEVTLTALRCLAHFFTTKNRKKDESNAEVDIPYILNERMVGCLSYLDCLTVYLTDREECQLKSATWI